MNGCIVIIITIIIIVVIVIGSSIIIITMFIAYVYYLSVYLSIYNICIHMHVYIYIYIYIYIYNYSGLPVERRSPPGRRQVPDALRTIHMLGQTMKPYNTKP